MPSDVPSAVPAGHAFPVIGISLPQLVQYADIICIGTTRRIQVEGDEKDRQNSMAVAFPATADFTVEQVIKGSLSPGQIQISFRKNDPHTVDGPFWTEIAPGERVLLFLNKAPAATQYSMTGDGSAPGPKILIGTTPLQDNAGLTPYRAVLRCLAAGLSDKDVTARRACARYLGDIEVGLILNYWRMPGNAKLFAKYRQNLQEPPGGLEAFMAQVIVPTLLHATMDTDEQVRQSAYLAAAELHREEVLPKIAQLVQKEQLYSYPLTFYHTTNALPFLLPLLSSDNAVTRMDVADTLAGIGSRLALPGLLDQLNAPHPLKSHSALAQFSIIRALYVITGIPQPKNFAATTEDQWESSPEKQREYLPFWKTWAASHAQELNTLRQRIRQPSEM